MKLFRFVAADTQKAMQKVNEALGDDALVYSTKRIDDGIEILAGVTEEAAYREIEITREPHNEMPQNKIMDQPIQPQYSKVIETLNSQLQVMDESIKALASHISTLYQVIATNPKMQPQRPKKQGFKYNFFKLMTRRKRNVIEARYGKQSAY